MPGNDRGAVAASRGLALLQDGRETDADWQGQAQAETGEEGEEGQAQTGVQAFQRTTQQVKKQTKCANAIETFLGINLIL